MSSTWTIKTIEQYFELPFLELLFQAQQTHRQHHRNDKMELCTLLNIKTGACPEDCGYCSQSGHYKTNVTKEKLFDVAQVVAAARIAKQNGAQRFCMGAAWRSPPKKDFPHLLEMVRQVKALGLETCVTAGMLDDQQSEALQQAGLDYYNHNLDTSPEYYDQLISTRSYSDRLQTLACVRKAGIGVCCGGILGMGETRRDRISLLHQLATLPEPPQSVPINRLMPMPGTPLQHVGPIDHFEFVRTIAVARIMMPQAMIRLSAGRDNMSEEMQALCFMAGANSIFYGEKLLTASNPAVDLDQALLQKLGFNTIFESASAT